MYGTGDNYPKPLNEYRLECYFMILWVIILALVVYWVFFT